MRSSPHRWTPAVESSAHQSGRGLGGLTTPSATVETPNSPSQRAPGAAKASGAPHTCEVCSRPLGHSDHRRCWNISMPSGANGYEPRAAKATTGLERM